jgi:hypothetical protein
VPRVHEDQLAVPTPDDTKTILYRYQCSEDRAAKETIGQVVRSRRTHV